MTQGRMAVTLSQSERSGYDGIDVRALLMHEWGWRGDPLIHRARRWRVSGAEADRPLSLGSLRGPRLTAVCEDPGAPSFRDLGVAARTGWIRAGIRPVGGTPAGSEIRGPAGPPEAGPGSPPGRPGAGARTGRGCTFWRVFNNSPSRDKTFFRFYMFLFT